MLLESQDGVEFCGAAYDGAAIVELAAREQPDVILMDIRMPALDGISATRQIRDSTGEKPPRVIVLTTHEGETALASAIAAGAAGFLMKDASPEFLLETIRTVHAGRSVISPSHTLGVLHDLTPESSEAANTAVISVLSAREREVFLFAARGRSNTEIAAMMFVSESTVKSHISSILAKLGVGSRLQLVALAYEHRLLR